MKKKRVLAAFMSFVMAVGLMQSTALANEELFVNEQALTEEDPSAYESLEVEEPEQQEKESEETLSRAEELEENLPEEPEEFEESQESPDEIGEDPEEALTQPEEIREEPESDQMHSEENLEDPETLGEAAEDVADDQEEPNDPEETNLVLPEAEASLLDILGTDENGNPCMYTTIYDKKRRIVTTNDPLEEQDSYYAGEGTVDRGAVLYVRFRFAEIIPHEGEYGVQENVTYCINDLPSELIPAEKDTKGEKILDPEVPVNFFQAYGDLTAYGGIYTKPEGTGYQLKIFFTNVEDTIDISGAFQYGTRLSPTVVPGEVNEITSLPGGMLSFKVTDDIPNTPVGASYGLSVSGGQGGPTAYYWSASIYRGQDAVDEIMPYDRLTLESEDAMGVWINESNLNIFDGYGDNNGPGVSMSLTYNEKDENGKIKNEWIQASENNIIVNENGTTSILLSNEKGDLQLKLTFSMENAVPGTSSSYRVMNNGENKTVYSYITNAVQVDISDGQGGRAVSKTFSAMTLYIPVISYDDYQYNGSVNYQCKATLSAKDETDSISANGFVSTDYGSTRTPSISDYVYTQDPYNNYEFFPDKIYSYMSSNTSGYRGNYYWMEFDPAVSNTTNANFYGSNSSFLAGNSLSSERGNQTTFSTQNAGTFLAGMIGHASSWDYIGEVSAAQVRGDTNLIANSCFTNGGYTGDAKLQYQLKKVFADADGNLIVYRSRTPHIYGEYMYLIVDPETNKRAKENRNDNGWYEYVEGKGSAKPASWRIHVFNAPCSDFIASVFQNLGTVQADDQNGGGSLTDQVCTGLADDYAIKQNRATCGFSRYPTSFMNAQWVDDNTIFWKFTFDASLWPSWNSGYFYTVLDYYQQICPNGSVTLDGVNMNCDSLYVMNPNQKVWQRLGVNYRNSGGMFDGSGVDKMTGETTLTSEYNDQTSCFYYGDSDMTQYRDKNTGDITLGFFARVNGAPNNLREYYSCKAEIIVQNGDISRFVGYGGDQLPTSAAGNRIQYPFKISASGKTEIPLLYKSGMLEESKLDKTTVGWTIQPVLKNNPSHTSSPMVSEFYGGYYGVLNVTDSMGEASAKDISGELVNIQPGKLTHITQMFRSGISIYEYGNGGGCGPIPYEDASNSSGYYGDTGWEKYVSGSWKQMGTGNLWDSEKPGIYKKILTENGTNTKENPLVVYVYYAGNMADSIRENLSSELSALKLDPGEDRFGESLVIEYEGLMNAGSINNCSISPITYTTEMDNEALLDAANHASQKDEEQGLSALYDLSLSNKVGCGVWKMAGKSPVSATIEKRMSALLSIQKTAHVISKNIGDNAYTGEYTINVVNGLTSTKQLELEDFITGFANVNRSADQQIIPIEKGTFNDEAAVRTLRKHLQLKDNLTIEARKNGRRVSMVYQKGAFTADWSDSVLELASQEGYDSEQPGSLFKLLLKLRDGDIPAGMEFVISYQTTLDMDTVAEGDSSSFRDSDYYLGSGLQIFNNASASRTYIPSAKSRSVSNDEEDLRLTVDCGGSVGSVYLVKSTLVKERENTSGTDPMHWMYYVYTGTMGKSGSVLPLDDYIRYEVEDSLSFADSQTGRKLRLKDLHEAEQAKLQMVMEHLVEKNTAYSNIKLYYTDTRPQNLGQNLSDADLIWDLGDLIVSGGTEITSGRVDSEGLKGLTLGETPQGTMLKWNGTGALQGINLSLKASPAFLGVDSEGSIEHTHSGFKIRTEGLETEKYLVAIYDVSVNWDAVYSEAQKIFGNYSSVGQFVNEVSDNTGEKADSKGNVTVIEDAVLTKSLTNSNAASGTADWKLTAYTGSKKESSMKMEDTVNITLSEGMEERVRTAASAATYVDPSSITVKCGSATIYSAQTYQAGWTEENLQVRTQGRHLEITIQNTDSCEKLTPGQTYTVTYSTKLDPDVFLQQGGHAEDEYMLENTAVFRYGDLNLIDQASGTFKPETPVAAKKQLDQVNGNAASWTITASTGTAGRRDFTLEDTISSEDEQAISAMTLQEMEILVAQDGNEISYTIENLPEGASLTRLDGSEAELGKTGFDGFRLCFEQLPANTTVTIHYTTAVDREAYGADRELQLSNALTVSSADGAKAGASESAQVEVKKPFEKEGRVRTTTDGKTMLSWTMQVNLTEKFSQSELSKMQEVTISDNLSPVLKLDLSDENVSVTDLSGNKVPFTASQEGTKLMVHLEHPAENPSVILSFETECLAGVNNLVNQAELSLDGTMVEETQSQEIDKVQVDGQYGVVQSARMPVYTPVAWKYVDNEPCTEAGKYQFTLTEVDDTGAPLGNAYTETKGNDADGRIQYSQIRYRGAGTHYYLIKETGAGTLDHRAFLIKVEVVKVAAGYVVADTILSPESYGEVRFDNTTGPKITSFTVKKVWADDNNADGQRPGEILVRLYQGTQPYNDMAVTLNESNHWTYTWEGLPIAGGDYSAVEDPVPGYTCTTKTSGSETILTNTKNPAEPSITPGPSISPEPSNTPEPSISPGPSTSPKPSDAPKPSVTPKPSDVPGPSITSEPGITQIPDITNTPPQTDTQEQTPKTGDSSPVGLWLFLLAVSFLGIAGILTVENRMHRKK